MILGRKSDNKENLEMPYICSGLKKESTVGKRYRKRQDEKCRLNGY